VRSAFRIGPELAGFVVDVSAEPDINRLMLVSDVMVTDYSSAIFEFALLGRPIGFFAPDLEEYERERGFYFDYRAGVPGPVFTETAELARWLREGPFDTDRVRAFAAASFEVADGRASRRFVDEVILHALG
jgi:CDP-ribitol ribitolphosphotransferase